MNIPTMDNFTIPGPKRRGPGGPQPPQPRPGAGPMVNQGMGGPPPVPQPFQPMNQPDLGQLIRPRKPYSELY